MTHAKSSKVLKTFMALALTLALCLGMGVTVFAAPYNAGVPGDDAAVAITKTLQMPDGTTTPAATFDFTLTKVSLDDSTAAADLAVMPTITVPGLTFGAGDTGTVAGGTKTVMKETGSIFTAANMNYYWPRAGVYEYLVEETSGTYTLLTDESMTYSTGSYKMLVYVDNDPSGLYVKFISTTVVTPDVPAIPAGTKVPGTPGTPGDPATYSKMVFTNTFSKTSGPNPAGSALNISKVVTGSMANQSFYFDYDLTVTQPTLITTPTTYKVYVMEGATVVTDATLNGVTIAGTDSYGDYFNAASGSAVSVKLKHGQRLAFGDLHIGATYTVTEQAAPDWTPSYNLTANGVATTTAGTVNTALTVPTTTVGDSGANLAAYSNAWKSVTPTGLDINDLPFIMMLVLAAAAIITFVVVKYRKKAKGYNA